MPQPIVFRQPAATSYGGLGYGFNDLAYDTSRQPEPRERGDSYLTATKMSALSVFAETGNQAQASSISGVPQATLHEWVHSEEGSQLVAELRNTVRYNEGWRLARMVSKVLGKLDESLDRGDPIIGKSGLVIGYKPPNLKDITITASILIDKWMLICGSIGGDAVLMGRMDKLGNQLSEMGSALSRLAPSSSPLGPLSQAIEGENLIG